MLTLTHIPDELNSPCGRVKLIPWDAAHAHQLSLLLSDPRIWEQGFAPGRAQMPHTVEEMAEFIDSRSHVPALFTILVDGEIAGTSGVVKVYSRRKAVLIGRTVIGSSFWGIGLNAITKDVMLTWLFEQGVRAVECEVAQSNLRSLTSLTRLGFAEAGTRRRNTPGGRRPWRTLILLQARRGSWAPAHQQLR